MNGRLGGTPSDTVLLAPTTLVSRPPFFCRPGGGGLLPEAQSRRPPFGDLKREEVSEAWLPSRLG